MSDFEPRSEAAILAPYDGIRTDDVERAHSDSALSAARRPHRIRYARPRTAVSDSTTSPSRGGRILIRAVPRVGLCGGPSRFTGEASGARQPSRSGQECPPTALRRRSTLPVNGSVTQRSAVSTPGRRGEGQSGAAVRAGAGGAALPAVRAVPAGDRQGALRVGEHREVALQRDLPEARGHQPDRRCAGREHHPL
jgi:hypothetical protein